MLIADLLRQVADVDELLVEDVHRAALSEAEQVVSAPVATPAAHFAVAPGQDVVDGDLDLVLGAPVRGPLVEPGIVSRGRSATAPGA